MNEACHDEKPALEQAHVSPQRRKPKLEQIFWQHLWVHEEPTLDQSIPEGLHLVEGTHTKAAHEEPHRKDSIGEVRGGLRHLEMRPC